MKAMDITAPVIRAYLGAGERELRFDHRQQMLAERYYELALGQAMGYIGILYRAHRMQYGALAACVYGALVSAGETGEDGRPLTWQEFDAAVDYAQLIACREELLAALDAAFPEDKPKNAEAQGETQA